MKTVWLSRNPDPASWVHVWSTQPVLNMWGNWQHARSGDYLTDFSYSTFYRATGLVIKPGSCISVQLTTIERAA
jgi:hypothetical protein